MRHQDRAIKATTAMTARAVHTKKVALYIIKNNNFTFESAAKATNVPQKSMSRIIGNLENNYNFEIDRNYCGRLTSYTLVDCRFLTKRKNSAERVPAPKPPMNPLRKPLWLNPLWALALQMQL